MQKKQQAEYDRFREENRKKEGEVTIRQEVKSEPTQTEVEENGEYVDFEEIN